MGKTIKEIVGELVEPFLLEHNYELVDIEFTKEGKHRFLRVFVDKDGGVDIEDCGRISEYLSQKLDETDPIRGSYLLEVSSPGAERPLKTPKDFKRSIGKNVYVTTYEPVEGAKAFEGVLTAYNEEELTIKLEKNEVIIPLPKVANARLAIVF